MISTNDERKLYNAIYGAVWNALKTHDHISIKDPKKVNSIIKRVHGQVKNYL